MKTDSVFYFKHLPNDDAERCNNKEYDVRSS